MIGDVEKEVNDLRAARLIGQGEREAEGEKLFSRIVELMADVDKRRKGLEPKRIYIGYKDFDRLRCWSGIHKWHSRTPYGDTLAGLPYYRVGLDNHVYVAWE